MGTQTDTRRAGGAAGLVDCHRRLASDNRVSPPKSVLNQEQSRARLRRQRLVKHLRSWAQALCGDVSGNGVICPGPGHSARDRSLSVTPSVTAPSGFLVHSFAGDDPIACLDYVRAKLGLPEFSPERSQNPATEAANEAIRFHPACPFGSERFPAMICLVRNIVTNEPQGIHRTALMPGGMAVKRNGKTFRLSLGSTSGGAIKLDPDEDVTQGICIGEGLETCLSGRLIGYRPIWSVLSTRGVARFPLLPGIDGLTIFGEYDEKQQSMEAIQSCAEQWLAAGKEVLTAWPMAGNDLNDELRRRHVH